jgi:hypothetical protein
MTHPGRTVGYVDTRNGLDRGDRLNLMLKGNCTLGTDVALDSEGGSINLIHSQASSMGHRPHVLLIHFNNTILRN